ncbi:MAG TPA: hypothetical protein VK167_00845 [Flavipsychrobacter sp.]|jgi:hypothetical protein|nr:hypothetical protein [Chitinophagales bacterium]HLO69383.1 hypothetical protein [Flavipsychrobacter sp.]
MAGNFTQRVTYNGTSVLAVIVPQLRKDGMYYEVNIAGFPRFYMTWSALERYDVTGDETQSIPYELQLAVSDVIEARNK